MTIQMYLSMQNGEYEIAFGIAVVLLILVLYLMYRESGDKELLFILGGMLFL